MSGIAQLRAAQRQSSASMPPMPPPPPPIPRVPPRWHRVARPAGVLPAAAFAGIVGACVLPIDRPGVGWLLTGTAVTAALCAVDYRARTRATDGDAPSSAKSAAVSVATAPTGSAGGSATAEASPGVEADSPAAAADPAATANPARDSHDAAAITGDTAPENHSSADAIHPSASAFGDTATGNPAAAGPQREGTAPTVAAMAPLGVRVDAASAAATDPAANPSAVREHNAGSAEEAAADGSSTAPGSTRATAAPESAASRIVAPRLGDGMSVASDSAGGGRPGWWDRAWWAGAALILLGVGAVRAAGWLFVLCVLGAIVAGSLAVVGRRSARGMAHDMVAVPLAVFGAVPWAFSGVSSARRPAAAGWRRYGVSVAATAALLVVFVPLLGGADATFAGLLSGLVPEVDGASAWQWILLFGMVGAGALGALYLLAGPPPAATAAARPRRLWTRAEWVLPVGALTVLFAAFVGAQFVALFGGDDYVQRTAGLTYAQYARSGFWQLSAVSILTLGVIVAVLHWSAQESAADRRWLRVLLSGLSVLTLIIVCSALGRMWTYQQAYGFTVLRLLVQLCELWVGLVYVLMLVAIGRLRWSWVSRAAIGTALGTLIALAVLNPERLVAERNIDRWQDGERLDTGYLRQLSPDVLPALRDLPAPLRTEIETPILADLDSDPWWAWNLSRGSAR
ncbi:DUF4173 domain-containing protein [Nocardia sp. SSK8]|uniref:DUF4173 domain-containing protein n=1 Tax=Nocardia sp. SSK8 TaxID=3120154 RepID=UPI0030082860